MAPRPAAPVYLGIIGTGNMAEAHAEAFGQLEGVELAAVCDLQPEKLADFALKFHIAPDNTYSRAENLLTDPKIDAVSIVTPDASHAALSIAALKTDKHVLCEKPLAINYAQAKQMTEQAKIAGRQNMVNFSYRNASALQQAHVIVSSGELGEIAHVEARYLQSWLSSEVWGDWRSSPPLLWRLSTRHGSKGVLGDLGVHLLDFASFPISQQTGPFEAVHCTLQTFAGIKGKQFGEYTLDANDSAVISARFANGALASLHTSRWATGRANSLYLGIYGTKGAIQIDLDENPNALQICDTQNKNLAHWYTIRCPRTPSNYERFVRSIQTGHAEAPDFARGAEIQQVLDACFASHEQQGQLASVSEIQ